MNSGSYQLLINIKSKSIIEIGALGKCHFDKGFYIYTGSAMRNLWQRVERHLSISQNKSAIIKHGKIYRKQWHIDYLLADKESEIISYKLFPSLVREECSRNLDLLKIPESFVPVKGFGSSDCRTCPAHLVGISEEMKNEFVNVDKRKKTI